MFLLLNKTAPGLIGLSLLGRIGSDGYDLMVEQTNDYRLKIEKIDFPEVLIARIDF